MKEISTVRLLARLETLAVEYADLKKQFAEADNMPPLDRLTAEESANRTEALKIKATIIKRSAI